ncbi:MAG: macro domain-containing protein [Nitrososphaeria archaeon]|jgi:O-acetyl-ADP-ribose deacetylase (regulator of RNase III)
MISLGGCSLELMKCDITELEVDAIVNAANGMLKMGGGVAGAIRRKAGDEVQRECDEWVRRNGPVPVGGAAITGAGRLRAKYVVHAVGPIWGEGDEERKLRSAFESSVRLAEEHGVRSIAFPAISAGTFGVPREVSARALLGAALDYMRSGRCSIPRVIFCLYDDETYRVFEEELRRLTAPA